MNRKEGRTLDEGRELSFKPLGADELIRQQQEDAQALDIGELSGYEGAHAVIILSLGPGGRFAALA